MMCICTERILSRFVDILRDCLQLSVNLSKSAVLVLQAHSAPPPLLSLDLAVPDLAYPCDSASGNASRPVGVDLPVKHAEPSDDSRLKYFKSV